MTGKSKSVRERLDRVSGLLLEPGVAVLLLVGLCFYIVSQVLGETRGTLAQWWVLVPKTLVTVLFSFAVVGLLVGYWIPRLTNPGHDTMSDHTYAALHGYGVAAPFAVWTMILFIPVYDAPLWLDVFGGFAVILGLGMAVEEFIKGKRNIRRLKRKRQVP